DLRAPHRGRWRKCRRRRRSLRRHTAGVDATEGGPVDTGTRRTQGSAALLRRGAYGDERRYRDCGGEHEGLLHRVYQYLHSLRAAARRYHWTPIVANTPQVDRLTHLPANDLRDFREQQMPRLRGFCDFV